MAERYEDLAAMSDDALVERYNGHAVNTQAALDFYSAELHRREMKRASDRMESMTASIRRLTWTVTVLTVLSVCTSTAALIVSLSL